VLAARSLIAFATLALWILATGLCVQECFTFTKNDLCCPTEASTPDPSPLDGAVHCVLSSALTKVQEDEGLESQVAQPPRLRSETPAPSPLEFPPSLLFTIQPTEPPEPWQFITRSALAPRAPNRAESPAHL
jgi:hypothetical protein